MSPPVESHVIGAYLEVCRQLSLEEFCARSGHAFLLHSSETGALVPTDKTRGLTVDRLVLTDDPTKRGPGASSKSSAYSVFALMPRRDTVDRVSVGCSSSCDVQINDESVSSRHATFAVADDGYRVADEDSAAGTQVNDQVVKPGRSVPVLSGDRVSLGYVDLTFLGPAEFYRFVKLFFGV